MDVTAAVDIDDPAAFLELEALASAPYARFVYDTPEQAQTVSAHLYGAGLGEFAKPFGRTFVAPDGRTVAMVAGPLDKKELGRVRLFAAKSLHDAAILTGSDGAIERSKLARDTLLKLADGDQYLSRIAVHASARGKGVASFVLDRFLDDARKRGGKRAVLEVSPAETAAVRLYESAGFQTLGDHRAEHAPTERVLVYRHMALAL